MPPCFFSPASATAETASNDNTAAAYACTLRMLSSLEISASYRADFLERYHGGTAAQPASADRGIGPSDRGGEQGRVNCQSSRLPLPFSSRISRAVVRPVILAINRRGKPRRRSGGLALLLFHEGLGALLQFLRCDIFLVGGDKPAVAGGIFYAAAAVAVEHVGRLHDGSAAGLDRPLVHAVHVWNIEVKRRHCRLGHLAFLGDHDRRVADRHLGVHDRSIRPLDRLMRYFPSERLLKEFDDLRRTAHGEIRRDSMIALGNGFCCHDWPPYFAVRTPLASSGTWLFVCRRCENVMANPPSHLQLVA